MNKEKRCEWCGCHLAQDHTDARFCSPCQEKLEELGLTETNASPRFYTVEEYARDYHLKEEQVRRKCRQQEISGTKRGRRWLILRSDQRLSVMPQGTKRGLNSAQRLISIFESAYPIREVVSDLTQQSLVDVVEKARQQLPPPGEVFAKLVGITRDSPPPHQFIHGLEAWVVEE